MIMNGRHTTYIFLLVAAIPFLASTLISPAFAEKGFPINAKSSCISSSCHSNFSRTKKYRHEVADDERSCAMLCHQLVAEGRHEFKAMPADISELCLQCHDAPDLKNAKPVDPAPMKLHKPVAEGKCIACHAPHSVDTYRLLHRNYPEELYASYSQKTYELCLSCHKGMQKALAEPRTLTSTEFRNGNLNLHYRHVNKMKGRTCRACHRHHGSPNPKLIANTFTLGAKTIRMKYEKTGTGGSCATACHIPVKYDRCEPEENMILTTPREGSDAAGDALKRACGKNQ